MNNCIFCQIIKGELPAVKVYEDADILAFLDIHPVNLGHILIVPKTHYTSILDTPDATLAKLISAVKKMAPAVLKAVNANSFNLGVNSGAPAGQVIFHTHFHIMPRHQGDGYKLWGAKAYGPGEMEKIGETIRGLLSNTL